MKKKFQRSVCLILTNAILIVTIGGCGGQAANPVPRYQPGDEKRSCNALYAEIKACDDEVVVKNRKKTDRDIWNVIWFVTGCIIIVPFFFIDSKGSYEVEIDALKARKVHLETIFADKDCTGKSSTTVEVIVPTTPPQQQQQQTVILSPNDTSKADQKQLGIIMVSSTPDDCGVYIDGSFVGMSPANLKLTAGIHIIEVKKDGYQTFRRDIRVLSESEIPVRITLQKEQTEE